MDMYAFKIQWRGKLPFIIIYRDRTKIPKGMLPWYLGSEITMMCGGITS